MPPAGAARMQGSVFIPDAVTDLSPLTALQVEGGALGLSRLHGPVALGALASLATVGGPLSIAQEGALTGLARLGGLDHVGDLSIRSPPEPTSAQALNALPAVVDGYYVVTSPKLPTAVAEAWAGTAIIGGDVVIRGNVSVDPS